MCVACHTEELALNECQINDACAGNNPVFPTGGSLLHSGRIKIRIWNQASVGLIPRTSLKKANVWGVEQRRLPNRDLHGSRLEAMEWDEIGSPAWR
jgi:hypothetical protein